MMQYAVLYTYIVSELVLYITLTIAYCDQSRSSYVDYVQRWKKNKHRPTTVENLVFNSDMTIMLQYDFRGLDYFIFIKNQTDVLF
jgi:hypothetical protein